MQQKANTQRGLLESYFRRETFIASQLDFGVIDKLIAVLKEVVERQGRVFVAGNGGSASTAEHFVVDLGVGSCMRNKKSVVNAISLSSNISIVTAIGNDRSFEDIFTTQLKALSPQKKDLIIAISASGNSPNIIRLLEFSRDHEIQSCSMTGFDGGIARDLSDFSIHVPTESGEYGITEDLHLSICHAITEVLRN